MIRYFNECVEKSLDQNETDNYNCKISLMVDGKEYKAYSVDISYRELTFNCEGDIYLSYDINSQGFNNVAVLNETVGI